MTSPLNAGRALARTFATQTQGLARCSRPQVLRLRAPAVQQRVSARTFAVSARAWEKKYTEDHEWIELADDRKTGTIGISTYAAKALGDVVYVELPSVDLEVSSGESIGAVESVKSASDIMTPVSGKIVEANGLLEDKPGMINQSPEGEGWLAKIEMQDAAEVDGLMDGEGYRRFTEEAESK